MGVRQAEVTKHNVDVTACIEFPVLLVPSQVRYRVFLHHQKSPTLFAYIVQLFFDSIWKEHGKLQMLN